MPTDTRSEAAAAASAEAELWADLAGWDLPGWDDVPPTEAAVVRFFDPAEDLERRASRWGHRLPDQRLATLAAFAAGLAQAEAEAWDRDRPHLATRAYEDRRFLLGDRLAHWGVPWLDAAGRCYTAHRTEAHRHRDALLAIGDRLRPAPALSPGEEGLAAPGEDAFGPRRLDVSLDGWIRSLWSGAVILDATLRSLGGGSPHLSLATAAGRRDLATHFAVVAARWRTSASTHPGTARLWTDLAQRADGTARRLAASDPDAG